MVIEINKFVYKATFFLIALIFFLIPLHLVLAKEAKIKVFVDKTAVQYDEKPLIKNGRTMVPIRKTMEVLGATVSWNQKTKKATIKQGDNQIILHINSKIAKQNGINMTLDEPAFIKKGRTYVPLRFISEGFHYDVQWDNFSKSVSIFTSPMVSSPSVKIPILMYHHIEKNIATGSTISPERFREHMIALRNKGYYTITDKQLQDFIIKKQPLPAKPILITFDDGYKSNITYAYPILKELDMKATIHLITSKVVDEKNLYPNEIPKLSWDDARKTMDVFSFQSHTNNLHFKGINVNNKLQSALAARMRSTNGTLESKKQFEDRILQDLILSKQTIEKELQQEVTTLAYPYGQFSNDTIRMAKKVGYKIALTVKPGKVSKQSNQYQLPRINGHGAYTGQQLINEINKY